MLHLLQAVLAAAFPALVAVAALRDATSYTIPNWISVALIGAFVLAAPVVGLSPAAVGLHAAVGAAGLVAAVVMFALGWIGGGDAKLFAAAALWLGWPAAGTFAVMTGMAGGGLALFLLGLRSAYFRPYVVTAPAWIGRLAEPGENVPYGLAIAVGALIAAPASDMMRPLLVH